MPVSVIVPCRNGAATVAATVRSVLAQTCPPLEVIVVDDVSDDATADVATRAGARVIRNAARRNAGGSRNAGIEAARGDIIAFIDADAIAPPDWLAVASEVLERDREVAGVGGRIVNGRQNRFGKLDYYMNHSEWMGGAAGPKGNVPTMAVVFRRSAIEGLSFPESNSGEDTAFALAVTRRGGKLWFDPRIAITHVHERLDWDAYWQKQVACGRTIFWTRSVYDRPGKFLVRYPILLWTFPHLWLMLLRMIRSGAMADAVALFPWFVAGEIARIRGFADARRAGVSPVLYATETRT